MRIKIQSNGSKVRTCLPKVMLAFFILISTSFTGFAQVWSLEQCIDTAQVHNQNLQISRNNIAIGEQKQKKPYQIFFPKSIW